MGVSLSRISLLFITKSILLSPLLLFVFSIISCTEDPFLYNEVSDFAIDTVSIISGSIKDWTLTDNLRIYQFDSLGFSHQSAASYGDYAFFVKDGRSKICLYNLEKKKNLYILNLKAANKNTYHCNQSSFGIDRYESSDPFPLLYISQRALSDKRCFIEVYRIKTVFDDVTSEYKSFSVEKVQTVYLPAMNYENSLGNANCVIDHDEGCMYIYSRNNNSVEDNYGKCKISKFAIPDFHDETVYLENKDILSSFMIDCSAINMQGGCINDGLLYIGQGYPAIGYVYLNVVDLTNYTLLGRIDLLKYQVSWEPEGCFFYDNCLMLTHTDAINKIEIR